jgi:hypothetical protein
VADSRKRRPLDAGTKQTWRRLAQLLTVRRGQLGYVHRPQFIAARARGLDLQVRTITDLENSYRPTEGPDGRLADLYLPATLGKVAYAYGVTYDSMLAVIRGEADELVPAAPAAPPAAGTAGLPPPLADAARVAAARPWSDRIQERLRDLAARGVTSPSGADVFPGRPDDARAWDELSGHWPLNDVIWMTADLLARDARPPGERRRDGTAG